MERPVQQISVDMPPSLGHRFDTGPEQVVVIDDHDLVVWSRHLMVRI